MATRPVQSLGRAAAVLNKQGWTLERKNTSEEEIKL